MLINQCESINLKHFEDPEGVFEHLKDIDDIYENIDEYNLNKKRKLLIVFDNVISHMLRNKKLNPILTELFIRGKKLNISPIFITQSYFAVPKNIRLNSTHCFIMKTPDKQELQQIAICHSSNIDF